MKKKNNNVEAFFALLRAGLWEKTVQLSNYGPIDLSAIQSLSDEQSVVGLITAGLKYVEDREIAKQEVLLFVDQTVQMEQSNSAMNYFIGVLVEKMRENGVYAVLVKGQGVAQCYERPLWRACGDVDFLLNYDNYQKAKSFLSSLACSVDNEDPFRKHFRMTIDPWVVELHGTMFTEISRRLNKGIDEVQRDIFSGGAVRSWMNDSVQVFLPSPDNDVLIIFTHFIQHFYVGGIGLRQICDWCRLLWTYRDEIDLRKLKTRLKTMGLMSEWESFAAFAVEYLGMPVDAMPFFRSSRSLQRNSDRICHLILEAGNFGHNKDASYRTRYPYLVQKTITFFRRIGEFLTLTIIFPCNAPKFFVTYVCRRVVATIRRILKRA